MEEGFLNWQVAFPGVWSEWASRERTGGFDAVIGNPPWDRMKPQQVEWFAARRPEIAHVQRAADRREMIRALHDEGGPLSAEYEWANVYGHFRSRDLCLAYIHSLAAGRPDAEPETRP